MRPISTTGAALLAAGQKSADAKPAADGAAAAGNHSTRRPRIRNPRQAQTTALAAAPPQQLPLPRLGTCYSFRKDGKCTFDNRFQFKYIN